MIGEPSSPVIIRNPCHSKNPTAEEEIECFLSFLSLELTHELSGAWQIEKVKCARILVVITFPTSARVTLVLSDLPQLLVSSLLLCTRPQNVLFVSDNTSKLSRVELRACYHSPSHIMSVIFIRMASACQICCQSCSLHVALPFPLGCFWTRHCLLLASSCLSLLSELTCLSCDGSLLNHSDGMLGQNSLGLSGTCQHTEHLSLSTVCAQ